VSPPCLPCTIVTPRRLDHISSCCTAAARNVSQAASITVRFSSRSDLAIFAMLVVTLAASPAHAQLGSLMKKADSLAKAYDDWNFTDAEEHELGGEISTKLRDKYGVVQDKAVHKYVTLVGSVLAQQSSRPNLQWTFIVLDTDGVNAFAAPGGFIHITRGALALIKNESELAGVLGHEIIHVTEKHTIRAIQKSKSVQMGASETLSVAPNAIWPACSRPVASVRR